MTGLSRRPALAAAVATLLCLAGAPAIQAQDSFGGSGQRQPSPQPPSPSPPRATQAPQNPSAPSGQARFAPPEASGEAQDFGVAPTPQLRPSDQLGGPTPTSIPGARVIGTQQLAQLLRGGQGAPLLLHAYAGMEHLPGAIAVVPAAQGGGFDDEVQRGFGQYLRQATGGDTSKMLVFYCGGPQCWGSYNASLRAIALGYRNVHWYRGGLQAWQQAGLPVQTATAQQGPAQ